MPCGRSAARASGCRCPCTGGHRARANRCARTRRRRRREGDRPPPPCRRGRRPPGPPPASAACPPPASSSAWRRAAATTARRPGAGGGRCPPRPATRGIAAPRRSPLAEIERQRRTGAENKLAKPAAFAHTTPVPPDAYIRVRLFEVRSPVREVSVHEGRAAEEVPEMLQGGPQAPGWGRRRPNLQGERVLHHRSEEHTSELQ